MKKKSSIILAGLAVIPIVSVLVLGTIANKNEYYMANEKGNRKEMGSIKLQTYLSEGTDYVANTKLTVSADKINKESYDDFNNYGDYEGIKNNKDFFRGKMIEKRFIDENDKYLCYASVENNYSDSYIDLYIKDLKTGEIKNKHYVLKSNNDDDYYSTSVVKISGGFVNVILEKAISNGESSEQIQSLINYKFDLSTGNFLKDLEIGKNVVGLMNKGNDNIYAQGYYKSDNESDAGVGSLAIYNDINDTIEQIKMPDGFDVGDVIENNGSQFIFSYDGKMIERTADGKLKNAIKLIDKQEGDNSSIGDYKIQDNKIYAVYSKYDKHGRNCEKEAIKVFALDTGREIYSGDIMRKGFFDSKADAVAGYSRRFI